MSVQSIFDVDTFKEKSKPQSKSVFYFERASSEKYKSLFESLSESRDNIKFYWVDVDQAGDVASHVRVEKTPIFMVFSNSKKVGALVQPNNGRQVTDFIDGL